MGMNAEHLSRRGFVSGAAALGVVASLVGIGMSDVACADKAIAAPEGTAAETIKVYENHLAQRYCTEAGYSCDGGVSSAAPIDPCPVPDVWDLEADIVVVGTGGGGVNAAVRARENGDSCIVVEKLSRPGGATMHASVWTCLAGGSRIQNEVEYALPTFPFDPDAAADLFMKKYKWGNRELVRQLLVKGPEVIDWMEEKGIPWEIDYLFGKNSLCYKGSVTASGFYPLAGKYLTDHMYNLGVEMGAQYFFDTPCTNLVWDTELERVVGIRVTNIYGEQPRFIHAKKGVLFMAGGFANNRSLQREWASVAYHGSAASYGMPGDTGECTRMCLGLGAGMAGIGSFSPFDGGIADYEQGTGSFHHYLYSGDNQLSRQPWLGIDADGNRYAYDTSEAGTPTALSSLHTNPDYQMANIGFRSYVIFDSNYPENIWKLKQQACRYPVTVDQPGVERMDEFFAPHDWLEGVDKAVERGAIKKADTLEELAAMLELKPEVVVKAVEDWNAMCAAGEDPDWGYEADWLIPIEDAPYYGIKIGGQILSTNVGVAVTTSMEVRSVRGGTIKGLYAGFHTAGGLIGRDYWEQTTVQGAIGASFTSGYIAADAAHSEGVE